jgi:hypothetical protein
MMSVVRQNVLVLRVIMLGVIILSAMAPFLSTKLFKLLLKLEHKILTFLSSTKMAFEQLILGLGWDSQNPHHQPAFIL